MEVLILVLRVVGFSVCLLLGLFLGGYFRPCTKCGSRLTSYDANDSPNAHYGSKHTFPYIHRHCFNCGHTEIIKGVIVSGEIIIDDAE